MSTFFRLPGYFERKGGKNKRRLDDFVGDEVGNDA